MIAATQTKIAVDDAIDIKPLPKPIVIAPSTVAAAIVPKEIVSTKPTIISPAPVTTVAVKPTVVPEVLKIAPVMAAPAVVQPPKPIVDDIIKSSTQTVKTMATSIGNIAVPSTGAAIKDILVGAAGKVISAATTAIASSASTTSRTTLNPLDTTKLTIPQQAVFGGSVSVSGGTQSGGGTSANIPTWVKPALWIVGGIIVVVVAFKLLFKRKR